MTDVTWIWIGNRPMLDETPGDNITQTEADAANGWSAAGTGGLQAVDVTGPNEWSGWDTTYQSGTDQFNYDQPPGGSNNVTAEIVTFIEADFEIETEDSNGDPTTITKSGILLQADNGDTFIRPSADSVNDWNDFSVIYSITVKNADTIPDGTTMAKVGFNPEIKDVETPPPCFTPGTLIETDRGEVAVEDLRCGDRVWTRDRGFQAITWIGGRKLDATLLELRPNLRPIRIAPSALSNGIPARELIVSPQHRILVRSAIAERMFGCDEVLIAAKHLVELPGIDVAADMAEVEYIHFLLGQHAVLRSNGAQTESLFPGPEAMKGIPSDARAEILILFPELAETPPRQPEPARFLPKGRPARKLATRHARNKRELVQTG